MRFCFCVFSFIFCFKLLSQDYIPYYNKTSEAEWYYDNGGFDEAKAIFEQAFQLVKTPKTKDIWLYSIILSKRNESKKIYPLLKKHIKAIGGTQTPIAPYLEKDGIQLTKKQIKKIDSYVFDTLSQRYQSEMEALAIIESMHTQDQLIRKKEGINDSVWWVSGNDSVFVKRSEKMKEIDLHNFEEIKTLLDLKKLQNHRFLDEKFSRLLIHMNFDEFVIIENELNQMVKNGVLDPWDFGRTKERAYSEQQDCPLFFVYTFSIKNLKCTDYEDILKNRKSIGLSTYYNRPSFNFYIKPGRMMKTPFREFYETEISKKSL